MHKDLLPYGRVIQCFAKRGYYNYKSLNNELKTTIIIISCMEESNGQQWSHYPTVCVQVATADHCLHGPRHVGGECYVYAAGTEYGRLSLRACPHNHGDTGCKQFYVQPSCHTS